MALTMIQRYLVALGTCIIIVIEANDETPWTCSTAQKCALTLEQNFNESTSQNNDSYVIDFCLKKMKDFGQKCFYDAVIKCNWAGNDPEYYRLRGVQKKFQDKCSEICPVMEEIQTCARIVDYGSFIQKKIQSFCLTYKESVSCKNKALSGSKPCSFGEKLFNQDFDEDTLRVFNYICDSGCEDILSAWTVLERCTSTHNLNSTGIDCGTYQGLELCLSKQSTCPQIHLMAPYFARSYGEHMVQCPLPMPDRPELDETTMDSSSKQNPTTDLMPMEEASISNQDLTEDSTKLLTTKENSVTSITEVKDPFVDYSTISSVNDCLLEARRHLTESGALCKSVQCLSRLGTAAKDLPLLGLDKSLEQSLFDIWTSCVDDATPNRPSAFTTYDVGRTETRLTDLKLNETQLFRITSDKIFELQDSTVHSDLVDIVSRTEPSPTTRTKSGAYPTQTMVGIVEDLSDEESKNYDVQYNLQTGFPRDVTKDGSYRNAAKSSSHIIASITATARYAFSSVSYNWFDVTSLNSIEKPDSSSPEQFRTEQSQYVGNGTSRQEVAFLSFFLILTIPGLFAFKLLA